MAVEDLQWLLDSYGSLVYPSLVNAAMVIIVWGDAKFFKEVYRYASTDVEFSGLARSDDRIRTPLRHSLTSVIRSVQQHHHA